MTVANKTAMVIGASRGLGRGVALALANQGASIVAVGRDSVALAEIASDSISTVVGDATDPALAVRLLADHDPELLVVVAGGRPVLRPIQEQTWASFSQNWHIDTRIAFEFVGQALRQPLKPGSAVVTFSSGAAVVGSPLSGGYAAANAGVRFITQYAADEADRLGLGIRFSTLLPKLSHATDLGREAVEAYAERAGAAVDEQIANMGDVVTPESAGRAVVELLTSTDGAAVASLLTAEGLQPIP